MSSEPSVKTFCITTQTIPIAMKDNRIRIKTVTIADIPLFNINKNGIYCL